MGDFLDKELNEILETECVNCGGILRHHRRRDERCPLNGEYQSIWKINKKEPWKEVPESEDWEKTTFKEKQ